MWCVLPTDEVATLLSKEEVVATPTELYYPWGRTGFRFNPPPPHLRHNAPSSTAILAYTSHSREVKEIEHIKRTNKRLHILDCGRERKKSKSGKGKKREEVRFHLLNTLTRVFLFLSCLFFFVYQNSYPSTLNVFPYCKYPSMILSTGSGSPMLSNVNAILACPWICPILKNDWAINEGYCRRRRQFSKTTTPHSGNSPSSRCNPHTDTQPPVSQSESSE